MDQGQLANSNAEQEAQRIETEVTPDSDESRDDVIAG
jgi:hypothetical protein